jgi:hypothetical protein
MPPATVVRSWNIGGFLDGIAYGRGVLWVSDLKDDWRGVRELAKDQVRTLRSKLVQIVCTRRAPKLHTVLKLLGRSLVRIQAVIDSHMLPLWAATNTLGALARPEWRPASKGQGFIS